MEEVKSLTKEQIEHATTKPIEIKEPSVTIRMESNTNKLPKHIRLTRNANVSETKIYERMDVQEDIENELNRRNRILNIILVISIIVLIIIIVIFVGIGLQLLGVI